jgi:hypothetical protein
MGLSNSKSPILYPLYNTDCLICWEPIDSIELVFCIRCNIQLHAYCEQTYRGGKGYCKCPHCQQVGTLGTKRLTNWMGSCKV